MVNSSACNVDTIVDDEPNVLPEQGQEMREHAAWQQPPAPAQRPQTLKPHPQPRTPECYPLSGLEFFGVCDAAKTLPSGANSASH